MILSLVPVSSIAPMLSSYLVYSGFCWSHSRVEFCIRLSLVLEIDSRPYPDDEFLRYLTSMK